MGQNCQCSGGHVSNNHQSPHQGATNACNERLASPYLTVTTPHLCSCQDKIQRLDRVHSGQHKCCVHVHRPTTKYPYKEYPVVNIPSSYNLLVDHKTPSQLGTKRCHQKRFEDFSWRGKTHSNRSWRASLPAGISVGLYTSISDGV